MGDYRSGKLVAGSVAASIIASYSHGSIIGVGSGSTVKVFIDELRRLGVIDKYVFISTSYDTTLYLRSRGAVNIESSISPSEIDVSVDGADEVDRELNLLKGGGGALFREKIVFKASRRRIVVVDESKLVDRLASRFPIPVEVVPFSLNYVIDRIKIIIDCDISIRESRGKLGPLISDNGNFIIDLKPRNVDDPRELDLKIRSIDGVVATGIFPYDGYEIIVGYDRGEYKVFKK